MNDINEPLQKPIKNMPVSINTDEPKPKKPRNQKTPEQLEQFEKVRQKRLESLKQKTINKKIEASKLLLEHGIELPSKAEPKLKEELPQAKPKYHQELTPIHKEDTDNESDDEPPVIIVKKKKKKKQPKTIIIEESESEEEDAQQHYINKVKEARHFVSQQNKKSLIKVHKKHDVPNYFVD